MKYFFLSMVLLLSSIPLFCQANFTISGTVVDGESKEPLYGASVFAQNTTTGTTTNKEGKFLIELKSGGYDLIISYTGYQTKLLQITSSDNNSLSIELSKEDKSMGEVVIRSTNEVKDGWEKYGSFFIEHFIGSTPFATMCMLQNSQALKFYFYKRSNKLKVLATEPLQIINKALGYNLRYQLDSFVYYYKTEISSYRGYCFFSEDTTGTSEELKKWKYNREKAYYGSKLHFMRSYYDSTLAEEGYMIDLLDEGNNTKFIRIHNFYDTTYFLADDSTSEIEVYFPGKISVTYKKAPEEEYLKKYKLPLKVKMQISYVDLLDAIAVKQNGYYYDQKDWVNQGYWSWKNLADMLPYDYNP